MDGYTFLAEDQRKKAYVEGRLLTEDSTGSIIKNRCSISGVKPSGMREDISPFYQLVGGLVQCHNFILI
jgi:hypothetical protein